MTSSRTLDLSHLKPYEISNHSPLWWGQLLMAGIEASMFFILLAMYFYIRLSVDVWPPPGTQLPPVGWASISLLLLIASAYGSYVASEGAKANQPSRMIYGLLLNLVLATASMGF